MFIRITVLVAVMCFGAVAANAQRVKVATFSMAEKIRRVESNLEEVKSSAQKKEKKYSVQERMSFYKIPGVSIAVVNNNDFEWAKAYGDLKAGSSDPTQTESIFEAGTATQLIVAIAALQLAEQGKVDLDADANTYLKSWKIPDNTYTSQKKITLRMLLSHRSGLNNPSLQKASVRGLSLERILKNLDSTGISSAAVARVPGTERRYSDLGYLIAERLLEDVSGKYFSELAKEMIFDSLHIESSTFTLKQLQKRKEAVPHAANGTSLGDATAIMPNGLFTTPSDLSVIILELMLSYQGKSARLLKQESARQLFHRESDIDAKFFGAPAGEGLGVYLQGEGKDFSFFSSSGDGSGSSCWLIGFPELGKGAIVMTNGANGSKMTQEIAGALAKEYQWSLKK